MKGFDRIATRYLLPALLLALAIATYLTLVDDSTIDYGDEGGSLYTPSLPSSPGDNPRNSMGWAEGSSSVRVGGEFHSLAELDAAQQQAGFVRVGLFGNHWPAQIVEVQSDTDGIRFVRSDGTPHTYSKFEGYCMQMVRLRQGLQETLVVYRSSVQQF